MKKEQEEAYDPKFIFHFDLNKTIMFFDSIKAHSKIKTVQ